MTTPNRQPLPILGLLTVLFLGGSALTFVAFLLVTLTIAFARMLLR